MEGAPSILAKFNRVLNMLLRSVTLSLLLLQSPAPDTKPLPDRTNFLIEFQVKRPGIYKLMGAMHDVNVESQYTYTETTTELSLDSKGKTKSSKRQVVDHIPTRVPGYIYQRQIVKDGVPLTEKELDKQDKKHAEDLAKAEANRQKWQDDAPKRAEEAKKYAEEQRKQFEKNLAKSLDKLKLTGEERKAREQKEREEYEAIVSGSKKPEPKMENSPVLRAADFQLIRREVIDGISTILLTFQPNPKFKGPSGNMEMILQHVTGRVWVSEQDYVPVKLEAEIKDTISFGLGLLAKIKPGSKGTFEWRKINNEAWLPTKADFAANARLLLVKGMNIREITEYTNHKKYVVSSEIRVESKQPTPETSR